MREAFEGAFHSPDQRDHHSEPIAETAQLLFWRYLVANAIGKAASQGADEAAQGPVLFGSIIGRIDLVSIPLPGNVTEDPRRWKWAATDYFTSTRQVVLWRCG
ncbi:hypothetical protein ACFY05_08930 [Microtetraspora fusca]|uniref:Uncharacterized protein n=1 Tax=Microtetraspora fusca TaxID=1997 RepID=A0ABW6V1B0_MICFU